MMIYIYYIIILLKVSLSISTCKEGENNCILCHPITKVCLKCDKDIYTPDEKGGCELKSYCRNGYNDCIQCENEKICKKCEEGYFPDSIGGCSYSNHCIISYKGKCLKCEDNYILIGRDITYCKSTNSEDLKYCKDINIYNGFCSNCTEGYYLNSYDQKCSKIENCSESIFGVCKKCNTGYYLDKKVGKCKIQNNTFIHCKETINGEMCDSCEEDYFFDEEKKCINIKFCILGNKENSCKKCYEGYYLSEFKDSCTKDKNCYQGDKNLGICIKCKDGFYIDFSDGKCKSNKDNDEFKNCRIADNGICTNCIYGYALGNDLRCSTTKYCEESENGICVLCVDNYYLGFDNKCNIVENCIYSNDFEECIECKDNYYYNKRKWKCEISTGIFKGCKYGYDDWKCSSCKNNYYLNQTDNLCYNNENEGPFYKCAMTNFDAKYCVKCIDSYNIGEKDHKCSLLKGCKLLNDENKCIECNENYCLDINRGICEKNFEIISEEKKYYFRCIRTNEEGNGCQICENGFILNKRGLCIDEEHCSEKNAEGICQKCLINENGKYCLNKDFGCIETYFEDCLECGDILDFDKCTKCKDGYKIGEYNLCYEIEKI